MRKIFVALLATAGVSVAAAQYAAAADLTVPYKAPPPPPPPPSWTGFYIGINGGAGWGTTSSNLNVGQTLAMNGIPGINLVVPLAQTSLNGWLAGGQVGYNYQMGKYLIGIEGDADWADIGGTSPCLGIFNCSSKVKWTADITGRVGVFPVSSLLVYLKGGASWAGVNDGFGNGISGSVGPISFFGNVSSSFDETRLGGLLGIGTEYLFAPHWTAKIEYNYVDYGKQNDTPAVTAAGGISIVGGLSASGSVTFPTAVQTDLQVHTVKAGVNYMFSF